MPFIGNQPALSYTSFAKQDFTTSATTSYTLDNSVTNENELALFINFVRQEPTTAYTASGTSLTLTSATSASDDMYCVYLGKAVQTVNPPSGSVGTAQLADSSVSLAKLSATGTKDSTTFLRGDNTFASAGGTNTPAFFAIMASSVNVSYTRTKVTLGTEVIDTAGAFASSRFTVPSGQAGKYFIFGSIKGEVDTDNHMLNMYSNIYKNGSNSVENRLDFGANEARSCTNLVHALLDLSVGDYVELYGLVQTSSSQASFNAESNATHFGGYKIIE